MRILFARSPQSALRQWAITPRNVLMLLGVVLAVLMVLNLLANWLLGVIGLGYTDAPPALAVEARYEQKLSELGAQISELNARIQRLDNARQKMLQESPVSPPTLQTPGSNNAKASGGQGGPLLTAAAELPASNLFSVRIDQLQLKLLDMQLQTRVLSERMYALKHWQAAAPTGYPLPYEVTITSLPGVRTDPFTGVPSWHAGTDYAGYAGMPILATGDGYVVRAGWDKDFGNLVEIAHPGVNATTRYAHAEAVYVKLGQRVRRGEAIARVGSTGRSTAPHLHYEVQTQP